MNASVADYLLLTGSNRFFGMTEVPLMVMVLYQVNRDDWDMNYLLKQQKRKRIFRIQSVRATVVALFMTVYHMVSVCSIVLLSGKEWINWNQKGSFFEKSCEMVSDITFPDFLWRYMLELFILIFVLAMFALVMSWWCNQFAAVLAIVCMSLMESSAFINGELQLLTARIMSKQNELLQMGNVMGKAVFGAALLVMIFILGICVVRRKEFYQRD